jgi:phosphoribosylaminoimidazolecarboxamide formyltransferase/IMP cyclohydrolase
MPVALFSVYDKSGLVEFARELHTLGWSFLASGGTARVLRAADLPVKDVSEYTGSPEILNGRVKTLHPTVSGGILARMTEDDAKDLGKINASYIDLVVCNLYPFQDIISKTESTPEDAIENIDIGGVTLIRAAAKNFARVVVLTDPVDYDEVSTELKEAGKVSAESRRKLANKAFAHTATYDAAISSYLNEGNLPD